MRIFILCCFLLLPLTQYAVADEAGGDAAKQRGIWLANTLSEADRHDLIKALNDFGVADPPKINRTVFLAYPKSGTIVPAGLKVEQSYTQPTLHADITVDCIDGNGRRFSISLLLGQNGLLEVEALAMQGMQRRSAPFYPGEPKVGHYANSGWLDIHFCLNNCVVGIVAPVPEGKEIAPDWPKIFEPIARQMVAILSTQPAADAKDSPELFNVKTTKEGKAQIIECQYDASIDDFWIRCETSSGKLIRLDRNRAKWLPENDQDADMTLVAISADGKTTYKATAKLQSEGKTPNAFPALPDFKAAPPDPDVVKEIGSSHDEICSQLLTALHEPDLSNEAKTYIIYLLGVYQVEDAVPDLLALLDLEAPFTIEEGYEPWGVHPAAKALRKIGRSATNGIISSLANEKRDDYRAMICELIMGIEGNMIAPVILREAIDKEQDKDKKANLTAALELLNKRIKEDAERTKQPENPTAPPAPGTGGNP
jgi:hypothetical protein